MPYMQKYRGFIVSKLGRSLINAGTPSIAHLRCFHGTRDRNRFDDHLRLSQGIFIGKRQVDEDLVVWRREGC